MNPQQLATINPTRRLSHVEGQTVTMNWDDHQFRFTRASLSRFARTLQQGTMQLYVGNKGFSVVAVDEETREVWIGKICLSLNQRDYRALLNAALRTETRLHGLRRSLPQVHEPQPEPAIHFRAPETLRLCWN